MVENANKNDQKCYNNISLAFKHPGILLVIEITLKKIEEMKKHRHLCTVITYLLT